MTASISRLFLTIGAAALLFLAPAAHAAPGDLDPGFGLDGVASFDMKTDEKWKATTITVQPDGKIVLGVTDDESQHGLVRLTAAGAKDTGFGTGGAVLKNEKGTITALTIQPDGKLLARVFRGH